MSATQGIGFSEVSIEDGRVRLAPKLDDVDITQLVETIVKVEEAKYQPFKDKITLNTEKKIPAIEELRQKVTTLQLSLDALTNDLAYISGRNTSNTNVFAEKFASIKSSDSHQNTDEAPSVFIRSEKTANADGIDHQISVQQIAKKDRVICDLSQMTGNTVLGFQGTLSINNTLVSIDNTDTLFSLVDKINDLQNLTNVSASLIQTTQTGDYKLILESNAYAEPINFQGTPPTSGGLFGLVPITNTSADALTDSNGAFIKDVVTSGFTCSDINAALKLDGTLFLNGISFPITANETSLNSLVEAIKQNTDVNVTASISDLTVRGQTVHALVITGNTEGVPIDFSNSSDSLKGLVPSAPHAILSAFQKDTILSGFSTNTPDSAMGYKGQLVLNNQIFELTEEMSLNTLITTINANQATEITARLQLKEGTTDTYQLMLTNQQKGQAIQMLGVAGTDTSLTGNAGLKLPTENTNLDTLIAKFTFDNIEMTRNNNIIKNLLPGVTFTLNRPSEKATEFSIEPQKDKAYEGITNFVKAYNEVVKALDIQKKQNPDGTKSDDAILYNDPLITKIEMMLNHVQNNATLGVAMDQTSFFRLSDIGISINRGDLTKKDDVGDGLLYVNNDKFLDHLTTSDYKKITQLFGNWANFSNPNFKMLSMPDTVRDSIVGRKLKLSYGYEAAHAADSNFTSNFSISNDSQKMNPKLLGKTVNILYQQLDDGTYSCEFSGIPGVSIERINVQQDGEITFSDSSPFQTLHFKFIGTPPGVGEQIKTSVTLPDYVARLSFDTQDEDQKHEVVIRGIQNHRIQAPKGSVYEGIDLMYSTMQEDGPFFGAKPFETTLTLTQGVAVKFNKILKEAVQQDSSKNNAGKIFDHAIQNLEEENKQNQHKIDDASEIMQNKKNILKNDIDRLYAQYARMNSLIEIIDMLNNYEYSK